jgi:hypothetical protein
MKRQYDQPTTRVVKIQIQQVATASKGNVVNPQGTTVTITDILKNGDTQNAAARGGRVWDDDEWEEDEE